jgi:predicted nucleotidyltransferase
LQRILENNKQILQNNQASTENTEFGKYVAKELDVVDDVELLNETKFEINNILYRYKKLYFAKFKKGIALEMLKQ